MKPPQATWIIPEGDPKPTVGRRFTIIFCIAVIVVAILVEYFL